MNTLRIVAAATFAMGMTAPAIADPTPNAPGQPNQSCGSVTAPNTPGNAVNSPGSAFNPGGVAPSMYAGQQPQNSGNPKAVSQYDVACFQQPATIFNTSK
jgi:hypothetical protein